MKPVILRLDPDGTARWTLAGPEGRDRLFTFKDFSAYEAEMNRFLLDYSPTAILPTKVRENRFELHFAKFFVFSGAKGPNLAPTQLSRLLRQAVIFRLK